MNRLLKKRIKKYFLSVLILLIAVSIFANSSIFAAPVRVLAENFVRPAAVFVLPLLKTNTDQDEQKTTQKVLKNSQKTTKNTEKDAKNIQNDTENQPKTTQKQEKNDTTALVSGEEKGGKVISQTIDKSGATASLGDVYIRNQTEKTISISKALQTRPKLKITLNSSKPQVLIVHTHATESYFPSLVQYYPKSWGERDEDTQNNMIAVGKVIAESLNKAGIKTVQSFTLHDQESYTGAYDRSRETIKSYLKKYPSIKVVLDVHRDAINETDGDKIRPIVNIKNKIAGQIMIISGCESGAITGYPNWQKNLRFNLRLQQKLEQTYPNLARPLFFAEKKYNQDLCENSFLLEVGSQANLLSEAKYSAKLFSEVFIKYLKEFA